MKPTKRLLIVHEEDINPATAALMVKAVLDGGVTSTTRGIEHPCFVTTFTNGGVVVCELTRTNALKFTVYNEREREVSHDRH